MGDTHKLNQYIDNIVQSGVSRSLYPATIVQELDISLTSVLCELDKLVDKNIAKLCFQIGCQFNLHILEATNDYSKHLGAKRWCPRCRQHFVVDLHNVIPIYCLNINDDICQKYCHNLSISTNNENPD